MGNLFSLKKKQNTEKENIGIYEKRYGYNLNDLHSYIYKINLPSKPAFINYVLEDKNSTKEQERRKENKEEIKNEHAISGTVDIYDTFVKENIHNSNNIYKNKLIINKESTYPIDDKYVHISFDKNYQYDIQRNNVVSENSIKEYLSKKHNIVTEKEPLKKTYINLCLNYYNKLNTCVIKKYEKNVQNMIYKYTRLHTCKPHYIMFSRCINYRDKQIMKHIKKIEHKYICELNEIDRSSYLNEFLSNLNYQEYLLGAVYNGVEKIKIQKELNELRERYNHIIQTLQATKEKETTSIHSKNKKNSEHSKKYLLLNV